MVGDIPKNPAWCSHCIKSEYYGYAKGPCPNHKGPGGSSVPYEGPGAFDPSDWVLHVVGRTYLGADGEYSCIGYDPRHGFWMQHKTNPEDLRNISERAIGRTYHESRTSRQGAY